VLSISGFQKAANRSTSGRQHNCVKSDSKDDIRRLGNVMMELMDGYVKEDGNIGVDNPGRWSPDALNFLSATTSASSAKELRQVRESPIVADYF
jgi:hypothetical protein